MILDTTKISSISLKDLLPLVNQTHHQYIDGPNSINEHYRLLFHISSFFENETILDIGTYLGSSAIALAYNGQNTIHTFDIEQKYIPNLDNIVAHELDILSISSELIQQSPLIMLDIDHSGEREKIFYEKLININYKGLMICDDIYLNDNMFKWWDSIMATKYDLTYTGHYSGTGLIDFSNQFIVI